MIESVVKKVDEYQPGADTDLILRACDFARNAHEGQTRQSGEDYISHPVAVAEILAELEMDSATIAAGLLHDVVEDTLVSLEQIKKEFGEEVAFLVDGVTKLTAIDLQSPEEKKAQDDGVPRKRREMEMKKQAENLRKILLAMANDIRVMIIKLADRLHNMRTLACCSPEKQRKVSLETMQIYAPLAHRLGIWRIKWQLEDLAFKYLEPEKFAEVADRVARTRREREADIDEVIRNLEEHLTAARINAMIQGRPKHLWSIYQKMLKQEIDFEEIYDLTAVRVIVNTVEECYHALGIVHEIWIPIGNKFGDYIAKRKPNLYQSLHTKVVGPRGEPLEIQIRTFEMHRTADFGVAAHWRYKEGDQPADVFEGKLAWLRQQMFDWNNENKDSGSFLRSVTQDLFTDQIFVFTPKGDVLDLPVGSTSVDFAYRVHSQVGDTCAGAKVNGRIVPLPHALQNGDVVEIITRTGAKPSSDWLHYVKSSHARAKIRAFLRRERHVENVARGRELLEKEADRLGIEARAELNETSLERILPDFKMHSIPDLLAAIGSGSVGAAAVLSHILGRDATPEESLPVGGVSKEGKLNIEPGGVDQVLIKRSKCCLPLPGDNVIGYVSRGRGMILHQEGCKNLEAYQDRESERLVPIKWDASAEDAFASNIKIEALDRVGLLNDISAIFYEAKLNIRSANIGSDKESLISRAASREESFHNARKRNQIAFFDLIVEVRDVDQLNDLMSSIRSKVPDVLDVYRISNANPGAGRKRLTKPPRKKTRAQSAA